ncbi:F0F1 ATP synthase subunit epsilon [Aestuariibius insulae]|uniref:F0F1 ATP synthase subunit epsilon n=1 Tax=Aestuariibius insulae TaxID=2058287 RepID=UPI00345EBA92
MADTMQFDLVSPERRLASLEATEVKVPGADGDMTVMPAHAPTITTLRPGVLRVVHSDGTDEYIVSGGFAEITAEGLSVLAEKSLHRGDVSQEDYDAMFDEMQESYEAAKKTAAQENLPGPVDEAAKLLSDMVAMGEEIGLSTRQPSL